MKRTIKKLALIIAIATFATINIAAARHRTALPGELHLVGNDCVCHAPGETNTPPCTPCGGDCLLGRSGH